jgi:hypothetical protein
MLLHRISEITAERSNSLDQVSPGAQPHTSQGPGGQNDPHSQEITRLEEQMRTLGQQLLRKQESLEEYLSERAALKVRLQDAQRRCQKYEEQVTALLEAQDPYDYESNVGVSAGGNRRSGDGGSLRKRGAGGGAGSSGGGGHRPLRASQDLESLGVHPSPRVTQAVDMIDTWTLITGRQLKAYPLLRLTFVFYLLFIHVWAFCLLAYHAHSLDLDNENANAMTNNKLGNH